MGRAASAAPELPSRAAIPKWSSTARPTKCTSPRPASARPIPGVNLSARCARPGDAILISGPIGDHGITILLARGELDLEADICSDTRPVIDLVEALAKAAAPGLRWMRDPTRGGVATTLNEFARDCGLGVCLFEDRIPVHDAVRGACELLGLDPLHIANEGQFLAVVAAGICRGRAGSFAPRARRRRGVHDRRSARAAGAVGAGLDTVRRHTHRRHAGGRPFAEDLLTMSYGSLDKLKKHVPRGACFSLPERRH